MDQDIGTHTDMDSQFQLDFSAKESVHMVVYVCGRRLWQTSETGDPTAEAFRWLRFVYVHWLPVGALSARLGFRTGLVRVRTESLASKYGYRNFAFRD